MGEHILNIVIMGDIAVGKSSLLLQFTRDGFDPARDADFGPNFGGSTITVDGNTVKLYIFDTSGMQRSRSCFHRNALGAMLVYDVSKKNTLAELENCLDDLNIWSTKDNIAKMVIGNQFDKRQREVSQEDGMRFAEKHGALFYETNAIKSKDGVHLAFERLVQKIIQTPGLWEAQNHHGSIVPPQGSWSRCSIL